MSWIIVKVYLKTGTAAFLAQQQIVDLVIADAGEEGAAQLLVGTKGRLTM